MDRQATKVMERIETKPKITRKYRQLTAKLTSLHFLLLLKMKTNGLLPPNPHVHFSSPPTFL
jgi:hypothetical protein